MRKFLWLCVVLMLLPACGQGGGPVGGDGKPATLQIVGFLGKVEAVAEDDKPPYTRFTLYHSHYNHDNHFWYEGQAGECRVADALLPRLSHVGDVLRITLGDNAREAVKIEVLEPR